MAAPNYSGALALFLGEKKAEGDKAFSLAKATASAISMSTADQLIDGTKEAENSPRIQGAGRVNVASMLKANSYLTAKNLVGDNFNIAEQNKVELKNSGDLYVKDADFGNTGEDYLEFEYTIHNNSKVARTYDASISVMIPALRIQTTHEQYAAEEESSRSQEIGYDANVTFNKDDPSTYPFSIGVPTMSVNDQVLTVDENGKAGYAALAGSITVPAATDENEGVVTGTARIRIDNLNVKTTWNDSVTPDFDGTLAQYFNTYFKNAGGSFVEGFLKLESKDNEGNVDDNLTLTMPYLGFYGDYTVADAVEPFDFEKDARHLYNSDLVDNYLHNLNANYAKPNAYTGSTLTASNAALSDVQLRNIAQFNTSPKADGINSLTVQGADGQLYAGAPNVSNHLNATFFINRSLQDATWELIDKGGNKVKNGSVQLMYTRSATDASGYQLVSSSAFGLPKSMLTSASDGSGYTLFKGYAHIDLNKVNDGAYTLRFNYVLNGVLDTQGNRVTQTKDYSINVDTIAPSLYTASLDAENRLTIVSDGANDVIKIGNIGLASTPVEGSDTLYTAKTKLSNKIVGDDFVAVTLYDFAHNEFTVLLHPSNLTFSVGSTFFTNKNDFFIADFDPANHGYTISILDSNGNDIDPDKIKGDFVIYIQLATGLNEDDIIIKVDSAVIEQDGYSYDATTGILTIKIPKGSTSFALNFAPVNPADKDKQSSTTPESSTTPDSSSVAPDTTSTAPSTSSSTPEPEKKGGCGGSVIAASSTIGALGALAIALGLKKKREDK